MLLVPCVAAQLGYDRAEIINALRLGIDTCFISVWPGMSRQQQQVILQQQQIPHAPEQRQIVVTYNILDDKKRKLEQERELDLMKQDPSATTVCD